MRMRKGWLALPILLLAGTGWFQAAHRDFIVHVPKASLQASVDARLPMKGHARALSWTVKKASVSLPGGGDIGLDATVSGGLMKWSATARVVGRARLSYRDGAFWLSDARVESVSVDGDDAARVGALEMGALRLFAAQMAHRSDGPLDMLLDRLPVYRLPTDTARGIAAHALVSSVRAVNGELEVRLDPLGAIVRVLGWCVVLLASACLGTMFLAMIAADGAGIVAGRT
jgi:hypothetical protein